MRIILLLSLIMFGCNSDTVTIPKDEYKQLKGDTIKPEYPKEVYWMGANGTDKKSHIVKIGNHEFLIGMYYLNDSFYMVHWPDCKFCQNNHTIILR